MNVVQILWSFFLVYFLTDFVLYLSIKFLEQVLWKTIIFSDPSGSLNPPKGKEGCLVKIPRAACNNFTPTPEGLISESGMLLWEVISQKNTDKQESKYASNNKYINTNKEYK